MKWTRAIMRETLGRIPKGADIAYARSPMKLAVGPAWVIIDLRSNHLAHAAESYAGVGAYRFIKPCDGKDTVAGPRTTQRLDARANKFLTGELNDLYA